MGRQRTENSLIQPKLKPEEWDWAHMYLCHAAMSHSDISKVISTFEGKRDMSQVAQLIVDLQASPSGRELIRKFSNALRQYRYRSRTKDRKTYTFMLTKEAKKALTTQAKHFGRTESDHLSELVTDSSAQAAVYQRREQQLQAGLAVERDMRKQAEAAWQAKHAQAIKQVKRLATLLSMWELQMQSHDPSFSGDQELLEKETMKKVKAVENAISHAEALHNMKSLGYVEPFSTSNPFGYSEDFI